MSKNIPGVLAAISLLMVAGLLVARCDHLRTRRTTLTVFTAASLTGAFTDIGRAYEAQNENVKVEFVFDGSPGAPHPDRTGANVDIFVSASTKHMQALQTAGSW